MTKTRAASIRGAVRGALIYYLEQELVVDGQMMKEVWENNVDAEEDIVAREEIQTIIDYLEHLNDR